MTAPAVSALWRHPLKGFPGERIARADLVAGEYFPGDRLFAIENGPSGFDPAAPVHLPKIKFLMLMRHAGLARIALRWDETAGVLSLTAPDGIFVSNSPDTPEGRADIEAFVARVCAAELSGPPRLLVAPAGYRFTDSRKGFVSIVSAASLGAIASQAGREIDARRMRGNIVLDGLAPWREFDLVGQRFRIGSAVLVGIAPIDRCAATDVDPDTGARDLGMVAFLERAFGHNDCGIYARVESGGPVRLGDTLSVLGEAAQAPLAPPPFS